VEEQGEEMQLKEMKYCKWIQILRPIQKYTVDNPDIEGVREDSPQSHLRHAKS
jgi:hypothetical protein